MSGFTLEGARGFTLIELLIVVAIIAILAAIAVPNFLEAQVRSKVTRVKSDLRTIVTAMEAYRVDNTNYPPDWDSGLYGVSPGSEWMTYANLTTPVAYLTSVPVDPFQMALNAKIAIQAKKDPYFQYNGYERPLPPGWDETGTQWFITSPGVDLDDDGMWWVNPTNADIVNATYDPSNGTRSSGDIGRSNVRAYPE
ncbi:MAG TPA: prepilin-type N-terminal cleavage/methylation domain-containing protein [Sumerlaeia bacterium]|nr:prepilin-type N-terminal cleavage/methylation domain-containing protein [Sumerlaeia bacterium]